MKFFLLTAAAVALALTAQTVAHAAPITIQDLGTAAPPAILGGYAMTPFAPDVTPLGTPESFLASPLGPLGLSSPEPHHVIGFGWATWSNGYTGDVYSDYATQTLTMFMPLNTGAFYFYAEPDDFAPFSITATADDGSTLTRVVDGDSGANGFGLYAPSGGSIVSVMVNSPDNDIAVGEFGIAATVATPEPATMTLLGLGIAGMAGYGRRRRKQAVVA